MLEGGTQGDQERRLTAEDLADLYRKMRTYRYVYIIYMASAVLYAAASAGMTAQVPAPPAAQAMGTGGLYFGIFVLAVVFAGRWAAFTPRAMRSRGLKDVRAMVQHIFYTLLFLLAAGESLGLVAVTLGSFGARPAWKLLMLCLWQVVAACVLTPDRSHWDRLLSAWDRTFDKGGPHDAP